MKEKKFVQFDNIPPCLYGPPPDEIKTVSREKKSNPIALMWKHTFDYKGKSDKSEFWIPFCFNAVLSLLLIILAVIKWRSGNFLCDFITVPFIWVITGYLAVSAVPFISLTVRRLHDTGKSGWWYLLIFCFGVGAVLLIFMLCAASYAYNPFLNLATGVYGPPDDEYYEEYDESGFEPEENVSTAVYGPPEDMR